jgi:hypothetical protein
MSEVVNVNSISGMSDDQLRASKARAAREQRRAAGMMALVEPFSGIVRKPLRWLWPWRVPLGKLTLLAGDPGLGKSLLLLDLAARVSRGYSLPDGDCAEIGDVVIVSAEDDASDTIRPRLEAAGADLGRVHLLRGCYKHSDNGNSRFQDFCLSDLEILADALDSIAEQGRHVLLVVIDPISAYLTGTDGNDNTGVRSVLRPLADMAAKRAVAIIGLSHLNKAVSLGALYRVIGSMAFTAAARAVYVVVSDQEDRARKLFIPLKCNLSPDMDGLAYRIETDESGTPCLRWEEGAVGAKADKLLGEPEKEQRTEQEEAVLWLRDVLAEGPMPAVDLQRQAREAGISWITIRRAKRQAGAASRRQGTVWVWTLQDAQGDQDSHSEQHEHLEHLDGESVQ